MSMRRVNSLINYVVVILLILAIYQVKYNLKELKDIVSISMSINNKSWSHLCIIIITLLVNLGTTTKAKLLVSSTPTRKYLKECRNQVLVESAHSLWMLVTVGDGYAQSAYSRLLPSIRSNTNFSVDAIVLEITTKPFKETIRAEMLRAGWKICQVDRIPARDEKNVYEGYRYRSEEFLLF
jgi:hypothetical protein